MKPEQQEPASTPPRPPSMADVAGVAGVSHQTVSRVLNGLPNVREGTRERVLEAIDQLGYRRNRAARALVTARTSTIGILTVGSEFFGPQSTVLAVEAAARARGYFVSVTSLERYDADSALVALNHLVDQGVDGVVVVAPLELVTEAIDDAALSLPMVVVAARPDVPAADPVQYVFVDQRSGARQATDHLLGLGHRRIVHVSGPVGWFDAAERLRGWRESMAAAGCDAVEAAAGDWFAASGFEVGTRLARQVSAGEATAVFAANDYLAIGLLRAFWEAGLSVPDDVSVVGFDDLQSSAFFIPALTTVRQPFAEVGRTALAALLDGADAPGAPHVLTPSLVVRGSTGAPRAS
nr:LacI family DNA-binding transcriptional regulator [Zhihengliuella salsuginis]